MNITIPRPNSVILTDWAADVDNLRVDRNSFVYQLLILSLLYDEILIQDELLVLSNTISNWFGKREDNWIWQELLDIESLVVLRHPVSAYRTSKLKSLAETQPINARSEYIQRYSTKGGQLFYPTEIQKNFYLITELCLNQQTNSRKREAGMKENIDIMKYFSNTLQNVLNDPYYSSWLNSYYPSLQRDDGLLFLEYINKPNKLMKAFRTNHIPSKKLNDQYKKIILNRSLAYQISDLFQDNKKAAFQQIIQAAFCIPLCLRENAVGRYGGILKALPPQNIRENNIHNLNESIVEIEAHVNIPIGMPELKPGFASIINAVRETTAGRNLRESVARLGDSITFDQQKNLWRAVAEELASRIETPNNYGVSIDKIGNKLLEIIPPIVLFHSIADNVAAKNEFLFLLSILIASGSHISWGVIYESLYKLFKVNINKQNLYLKLEEAVDFRCTWIQESDNVE